MQQRISTMRHSVNVARSYHQPVEHPKRMLFYTAIFSLASWAVIGLFSWGVWAFLQ